MDQLETIKKRVQEDVKKEMEIQKQAPSDVLAEAKKAAIALDEVIKGKKNPVKFNGEQYLEFEDWQTLAKFYGLTVAVDWVQYVDYGGITGFESAAIVWHDGIQISRAEAICMRDEPNWTSRPKFEYRNILDGKGNMIWIDNPKKPGKKMPKSEKIQVADEPVPLYQLKSMAQTRACAKALRNVMAWVAVLAGYKPTPSEELPHHEQARTERVVVDQIEDSNKRLLKLPDDLLKYFHENKTLRSAVKSLCERLDWDNDKIRIELNILPESDPMADIRETTIDDDAQRTEPTEQDCMDYAELEGIENRVLKTLFDAKKNNYKKVMESIAKLSKNTGVKI